MNTWRGLDGHSAGRSCGPVSHSQGSNLRRLVTPARTSGLSSIQGDLRESGKGILMKYNRIQYKYSQVQPNTTNSEQASPRKNGVRTMR